MSKSINDQRDAILLATLPHVPQTGWALASVHAALGDMGMKQDQFLALYPGGIEDLVTQFSDYLDRAMVKALGKTDPEKLRVRDRIDRAVMTRFEVADPYRDALRLALAFWSVPPRTLRAGQVVWRTADRMWEWAGDTATDYNRYTKRALLAGVLTSTTLVWLKDVSDDAAVTRAFLQNRIDNVLQLGQMMGKFKQP
jgi:ubiquinone biosynthesis protein COQ9